MIEYEEICSQCNRRFVDPMHIHHCSASQYLRSMEQQLSPGPYIQALAGVGLAQYRASREAVIEGAAEYILEAWDAFDTDDSNWLVYMKGAIERLRGALQK
jgi:hypothetical protein